MQQKSIVVPKAPPYWNCGVLGSRAKGKPKPDRYQSGFCASPLFACIHTARKVQLIAMWNK